MGVLRGKKLAFVFPGQGSQCVGMGRDLSENVTVAGELFERADSELGFVLSELCFNGPEEELKQTVNTQPALYVVSAAAFEAAASVGLAACCAAGHSVGEYAALYSAGALEFEEGLRIVRRRAELMQEASERFPGTMAAILGLSPEEVSDVVSKASNSGVVVAANFNSPVQTVISGEAKAVEQASAIALEMGAKRVVPLNVSGAFHSPLMQSAADALAAELDNVEVTAAAVPVVANFTADFETEATDIKTNLARQITGSVRWVESVRRMTDAGVEAFVELGPGNVLAGLIKRIVPEAEVVSIGDSASLEAALSWYRAARCE
jgi:[acyl-carrier-protein] S-malonyltransferase